MTSFATFYWIGIFVQLIVRGIARSRWKPAAAAQQRISATERALLGLLTLTGLVLPLVYSLTSWLDFADYRLPPALGWLGVGLLALGLYLFARAHADLKASWSPSLEIYQGHRLVTEGIYGVMRHPMYASQWLVSIAQLLLIQNWVAGPAGLLGFIPFYFLRTRAEDRMMLETFGEPYRTYMQRAGSIFPKRR